MNPLAEYTQAIRKRGLRDTWESHTYASSFWSQQYFGGLRLATWIGALLDFVVQTGFVLTCAIRNDHDLEDFSVATPGRGNIDLRCQRCGKSYHTILY